MYKRLHENVEFFFGKGVGSKIYDAINNAAHSIFILTPYISQGYIDFLLRKQQKGINVSLITTTEAQKGDMGQIYKKIVLQHRITDEKKLVYKNRAKCLSLLLGSSILIGVFIFFWHYFHNDLHFLLNELKSFWDADSTLIFIAIFFLYLSYILYIKSHRVRVYNYFYSTKFPFLVVPSRYSRNMGTMLDSFVHSKVYIIDNKDIFIGSANLTKSGLRDNIESFIKISTHGATKEIITEIDSYLKTHCKPIDINYLGASLYQEVPY